MSHLARAEEMLAAIQARYYVPGAGLYQVYSPLRWGEQRFACLWPYSGMLSAANALTKAGSSTQTHIALLKRLLDGLDQYWLAPGYLSYPLVDGGGERYYDDNEWIGLELLGAYNSLQERGLLDRAGQVFEFATSGWSRDLGGGIYWREGDRSTKNTCSNGPAIVLALNLYQATGDEQYVEWATSVYRWVNANLRSAEDVYWDNLERSGRTDKITYTYNTGIMIQANALLYAITGAGQYLAAGRQLAASSLDHFAPHQVGGARAFPATPWFNAVLLRGYLALEQVGGDRRYADAVVQSLDYAWDRVRDGDGLVATDWSGAGRGNQRKGLLDEAAVVEVYALAAARANAAPPQAEGPANAVVAALGAGQVFALGQGVGAAQTLVTEGGQKVLSPMGTAGSWRGLAGGGICSSQLYGSLAVPQPVFAYYGGQGGPQGHLGFPVAPAASAARSPLGTRGHFQRFEGSAHYPADVIALLGNLVCGATVYWADELRPCTTWFEIGACYERNGGSGGPLGYPTTDRQPAGPSLQGTSGYCQRFEAGAVYWSEPHGTHPVWGDVAACYDAMGGTTGVLGFPLSPELPAVPSSRGTRGALQRFEGAGQQPGAVQDPAGSLVYGATIYHSPATGAHATWGAIGARYESEGGSGSRLGFPVSEISPDDPDDPSAPYRQRFENGSITCSLAEGVQVAYDDARP